MKAIKLSCILLFGVVFLLAGNVRAFQEQDVPGKDYREGEVLVKYRSSAEELQRGQVRSLVRAWKTKRYSRVGIEKLSLGAGLSAVEAVALLNSDPNVEYAELNQRVEFLDMPRIEPDDPAFMSGDQWYLDTAPIAGYHITSTNVVYVDVDIDAPEAWAVMDAAFDTTMAAGVGVLDSGCGEDGTFSLPTGYFPNHQDLPNEMLWTNPDELLDPGMDSPADANTLIDDVNGWDFMEEDNTMADVADSVAPFHGTRISGIIAGTFNNGLGGAGMGKGQVKVQPLRVSYSDEILAAIDYAIQTSGTPTVKVLNASWKFSSPYQWLLDAITAAGSAGIVFVTSAGNGGLDGLGDNNDIATGTNSSYPAQFTLHAKVPPDNLLAVGATDVDGSLAWFSNYGPESVQIAAPGVDIYTSSGGSDTYAFVNGTSFSAPIAASAVALVMAANPALTPAEAINRVIDGGYYDARLSGLIKSGKRISLAGALAPFAPYSGPAPMDTLTPISLYADSVSVLYGSISNAISNSPGVAVMVTTSGGAWAVSPVSPGLTAFNLEFDGVAAPVGTYQTGLWRVTGISPFSATVQAGQSMSFTSLVSGSSIDWSVMDAAIGAIDSNGLFTALSHGTTRVVLNVDGQDVDNSGTILVIGDVDEGGGGGGGCGTTALPQGDPLWPAILVLLGMVILLTMRRRQAAGSPRSKGHSPKS